MTGPIERTGDNLATIMTGCYVCEQLFHPSMLTTPCPGDPEC